jgi:hypothetical protein
MSYAFTYEFLHTRLASRRTGSAACSNRSNVQGSKFKNGYSSNRFSRFSRKPFAAVVPIRNANEDTVALSTNRKFMTIIDRSRARAKKEGGISAKELRRRLGIH